MIDTLETDKELARAGFNDDQRAVLIGAFKTRDDELVTKDFLRAELAPLKWMSGTACLAIIAEVIRRFFLTP